MKISYWLKKRKILWIVNLCFFLLSNSSFAQNKLPFTKKTYYQRAYTCKMPYNEKLSDIICENCRDTEFSIQKDSIVRSTIDINCVSFGKLRAVYKPIKSYIINSNTSLYLLKDKEDNLFKTVFKISENKLMVNGPTDIDSASYNKLIVRLGTVKNSDKESLVFNNEIVYHSSYFSKLVFDNYSEYPKFTLDMYAGIKKDLSTSLPENLDHSSHSRNDLIRFNNTLNNYFIEKGLNPFHGNSYYREIQNMEKLTKGFSLHKFLNKLNRILTVFGLLGILWALYRIFNFFLHKKSKRKIASPSPWWLILANVLGIISLGLGGVLIGFKASVPIGHMMGFSGGNSVGILFVLIFSTPIGGIIGILLGVFIARKTKLV